MPDGVDVAHSGMAMWIERVLRAIEREGTPCYVAAWEPVADAVTTLEALDAPVPVRQWLSFKTHPLDALAAHWLRAGRGVEVVSEREYVTVRSLGATVDQILVNGVAKHSWLPRHSEPGLRVHFDSPAELDALMPLALADRWRVGVRLHAPDECDAREPHFGGQFGFTYDGAVSALRALDRAGADLQSVHFHLGQHQHEPGAYVRALDAAADACHEAAAEPAVIDCGGALPPAGDPASRSARDDLSRAMRRAPARFPALREIWIENGRFITQASAVLAVRVIDIKDRPECRYLICDGGRTNHALAADVRPHPLLLLPNRGGPERLTTICGPTCMTDDRLGRWPLPESIACGDVIVWLEAGAYHLPWETRFSHGLCSIVWFDEREEATVARPREQIVQTREPQWMTS